MHGFQRGKRTSSGRPPNCVGLVGDSAQAMDSFWLVAGTHLAKRWNEASLSAADLHATTQIN